MAQQQLARGDAALEAFDNLRVREVGGVFASVTLAEFQSAAGSLEPEERIGLLIYLHKSGVEFVRAVLSDPQADKICALHWEYSGKKNVYSVIPLLIDSCPELASLNVYFSYHSAFDFVSSVLEHPSNKIKVLVMPPYNEGDLSRFFATLGQSQVSVLTISGGGSLTFVRDLCEYLAKDLLVRLEVRMDGSLVPFELMMSLATCTCLAKLTLRGNLSQPSAFAHLPKSITKLVLDNCLFAEGFDWSFLADSNLQELDFAYVKGVNVNQLSGALVAHLRANGLDRLCFSRCNFAKEILATIGVEIGRVKRLEIGQLNEAFVELIALALQSSNSELRELKLEYNSRTMSGIEAHLVLALKHPNCNLAKLSFWPYEQRYKAAAKVVEDTFRNRRALFALLQGQQVRRKVPCPLRRLPVEMFRMVGLTLL